MSNIAENKQIIDQSKLSYSSIEEHSAKIKNFLDHQSSKTFKIQDTCRKDNHGILSCLQSEKFSAEGFVSFIPAAGASSRWLAPLANLINAFSNDDEQAITGSLSKLIDEDILSCPIPNSLREYISSWKKSGVLPQSFSEKTLLMDIESPKAFYPAIMEGMTFLEFKIAEDDSIPGLNKGVFICPAGRQGEFEKRIKESTAKSKVSYSVFEQGAELATVRFNKRSEMILEPDGTPSLVPAGHGALLDVLPRLKHIAPKAHSAWIRNIDNVVGTESHVIESTINFLSTHEALLNGVLKIRVHLNQDDLLSANRVASEFLNKFVTWNTRFVDSSPLQVLMHEVFNSDGVNLDLNQLRAIFNRPVVTMGQVPNNSNDVGGTAVFAQVNGKIEKLCIELPHASAEDKKKFLENPQLATHFNPVFVAAEIPSHESLKTWKNHPFWLIAKKQFRGEEVYYHESILYEMIGCSAYTNLVFVEIPRTLFNPHKSLSDMKDKAISKRVF